ncbi:hypothetical protein E8E14_007079 [Neopestalotiopsis sp. 37M]|nr:hypothetical protein E8E14_007079 [Neopestalotiopsis sp. 37M]
MSTLTPREAALQLRQVTQLLTTAIDDVATRWENGIQHEYDAVDKQYNGPRQKSTQDPVKVALAAVGHLESLIMEPHRLVVDMSTSYMISRALHIVADHDIAGIIADRAEGAGGLHVEEIARSAGLEEDKLYDFPPRGRVHYAASDHLPSVVVVEDCGLEKHGAEAKETTTAFQKAVGTDLSLFDWMNEQVPPDHTDWRRSRVHETTRGPLPDTTTQRGLTAGSEEGSSSNSGGSTAGMMVARSEKLLFHQAMAGLDRGQEHFYLRDYPWQDLGAGTVVDVGGGIERLLFLYARFLIHGHSLGFAGSFCMQLHEIHPSLQLVVQDREPVIKQAEPVWESEYPDALASGQVKLSAHDFFLPNPVQGADVYWLRYILHDWPDDKVGTILSHVAKSMTASSRLLIADTIVTTTLRASIDGGRDGQETVMVAAPPPLLANYGRAASHAHIMDLNMMMMVNGRERTPAELGILVQAAGLEIVRIWQGGAVDTVGVVECRLSR